MTSAILNFTKNYQAEIFELILQAGFKYLRSSIVRQKGVSTAFNNEVITNLMDKIEKFPGKKLVDSILLIPVLELNLERDKHFYLQRMIEMAVYVTQI